jgi:hypothetical protein
MKDGLGEYIRRQEVPSNPYLLSALTRLLMHVLDKPNAKVKLPYNPEDPVLEHKKKQSTLVECYNKQGLIHILFVKFNINDEPWPNPSLYFRQAAARPPTLVPLPTASSSQQSPPPLPLIQESQESIEILEDESHPAASNAIVLNESRAQVLQPITNYFRASTSKNNSSANTPFGIYKPPHEATNDYHLSDIKVYLFERVISLPRFSCSIEDSLQLAGKPEA